MLVNTHVLIVDDSEDDREMYARFLSQRGFQITEAGDGVEAVRKATDLNPNLIVMDLWLPLMGGWEASRRLKGDDRTKHIPIVVVTGRNFVTADALGCDACLIKPCSPQKLYAEILRVLSRPKAMRSPASSKTTGAR